MREIRDRPRLGDIKRHPFQKEFTFTRRDMDACWKYAKGRQVKKDDNPLAEDERFGVKDGGGVTVHSNEMTHYIGLLGEYAVGHFIGKYPDVGSYLSGDPTGDFVLHGQHIEVKTLRGFLAFNSLELFGADIAALVIHQKEDLQKVWVQGWIPKGTFDDGCFLCDLGAGKRLCVEPRDLHSIEALKTYCLLSHQWIHYGGMICDRVLQVEKG